MKVSKWESVEEPTNEIRWGVRGHWVPRCGEYVHLPCVYQKWTITQYEDGVFSSVTEAWRPIPDEHYVNVAFENLYGRVEELTERMSKLEDRGNGT